MLVIKRNGNIEEFDINKLRVSIINSADDINFILTEGDINILLNQIKKRLSELTNDNRATSTYEIRGLVYHALMNNGFKGIVKSYMKLI